MSRIHSPSDVLADGIQGFREGGKIPQSRSGQKRGALLCLHRTVEFFMNRSQFCTGFFFKVLKLLPQLGQLDLTNSCLVLDILDARAQDGDLLRSLSAQGLQCPLQQRDLLFHLLVGLQQFIQAIFHLSFPLSICLFFIFQLLHFGCLFPEGNPLLLAIPHEDLGHSAHLLLTLRQLRDACSVAIRQTFVANLVVAIQQLLDLRQDTQMDAVQFQIQLNEVTILQQCLLKGLRAGIAQGVVAQGKGLQTLILTNTFS
mmetsp:Transcript_61502/g.134661  ORF Transcript_61502/g.134661 Transcript_61502/m.134661 type:complete len:257 (-) Transcript_61502:1796-2566(-)